MLIIKKNYACYSTLAVFNGIDVVGVISNADILDAISAEEKKKRRSK
ncbi:MAG: hypothetical protein GW904_05320 [Candidatus Altiarchaeum hamiconexum]|nr:hypothetical protein [Candidatus Altarchaeum hamiconexum]NCT01099.1 hypothetical protein [Candidatus Altarchaeum hamiconexum]